MNSVISGTLRALAVVLLLGAARAEAAVTCGTTSCDDGLSCTTDTCTVSGGTTLLCSHTINAGHYVASGAESQLSASQSSVAGVSACVGVTGPNAVVGGGVTCPPEGCVQACTGPGATNRITYPIATTAGSRQLVTVQVADYLATCKTGPNVPSLNVYADGVLIGNWVGTGTSAWAYPTFDFTAATASTVLAVELAADRYCPDAADHTGTIVDVNLFVGKITSLPIAGATCDAPAACTACAGNPSPTCSTSGTAVCPSCLNNADCIGTQPLCAVGAQVCVPCNGDSGSTATRACPSTLSSACQTDGSCTAPAPTITAPTAGQALATATPTVSGTGQAGAVVTVKIDGAVYCTATVATGGAWSCAGSAIGDGSHTASATEQNSGGNASPAATRGFSTDATPPDTQILSGPNGPTNSATAAFNVSGTDAASSGPFTFRCSLDGAAFVACPMSNGQVTYTGLSEAQHTVQVAAVDLVGNVDPTPASRTFTVDLTAPATPAIAQPADGALLNASPTTVNGSAEVGAQVVVTLDGSALCTVAVVPASGLWSCAVNSTLSDAQHVATAQATDPAGNVSGTATSTFRIDAQAPATPLVLSPAGGAVLRQSPTQIAGSAEAGATVTVTLDGSALCVTTADAQGQWSCALSGTLGDGSHTVGAVAKDAAGNTSAAASSGFRLDSQPPAAPSLTSPQNNALTSNTRPPFAGTAEVGATVTVKEGTTTLCTATADGQGNWTCTPGAALGEGAHSVTASATDAAGNTGPASAPTAFTIDSQAPAAPAITAPVAGATVPASPQISGTSEAGATVTVKEGTATVCTATADSGGVWHCQPTAPLSNGAHSVTATATDAAGNAGPASAATSFTVDSSTPPAPTVATPADGSATANRQPILSGTAAAGATVVATIDGAAACTTVADASGNWRCALPGALADGLHTATAKQLNVAGTASDAATSRFTVDTQPPATPTLTSPTATQPTSSPLPTLTGTADPGTTVRVTVDGQPACTATADAQGHWSCVDTTSLSDGPHGVVLTSTDAAGNASTGSGVLVVDTHAPGAPRVTRPADGTSTDQTQPAISGSAEPGATVQVTVDAQTCSAVADAQGQWSCTVPTALALGSHAVTATATDAAGNTSAPTATTFTVDPTVTASPTVTAPPPGRATANPMPTVAGTAPAGATVTVTLDGVALCTATADAQGQWSCPVAAPLAEGTHTVVATAQTAGQSASPPTTATFSEDRTAPPAPTVTSPAAGSTTTLTSPIAGGGAEAGATVVVMVDGQVGCTATADAQGRWSCTLAGPLSEGAHTLVATAADAAGNTSQPTSRGFTVDTTAPDAPTFISPQDGATSSSGSPTVSGKAEPGSQVNVTVDGAFLCAAVADAQGNWSCPALTTPLATGVHSLAATARDGAGNTSPQRVITYTVDAAALTPPTFTAPVDGSSTSDSTPTLSGTAPAGSTVVVTLDGSIVCTVVATGGTWSCTTAGIFEGNHTATATASLVGQTSSTTTDHFRLDTVLTGGIHITSPASGGQVASTTPTVSGTTEENATVVVTIDGQAYCTTQADAQGRWSCTGTRTLTQASHTAAATATDAAGNTATDTATFSIDVPPGAPVIVSPTQGSDVGAQPTVSGTAAPGTTVTVTDENGRLLCTATTNTQGAWSCTPTVSFTPGAHAVRAVATDAAGASSPVTTVDFVVVTGSTSSSGSGSSSSSTSGSTSSGSTSSGSTSGTHSSSGSGSTASSSSSSGTHSSSSGSTGTTSQVSTSASSSTGSTGTHSTSGSTSSGSTSSGSTSSGESTSSSGSTTGDSTGSTTGTPVFTVAGGGCASVPGEAIFGLGFVLACWRRRR